jgi:hypothetical protein
MEDNMVFNNRLIRLAALGSAAFMLMVGAPISRAQALPPPDYGYYNTCSDGREYDEDTHSCVDYALSFCDEAEARGVKCYPVAFDSTVEDGHMVVVVEQSHTPTSTTYCLVEPQTGAIVGACWMENTDPDDTAPRSIPDPVKTQLCQQAGMDPASTSCKVYLLWNPATLQ